MSKLNAGCFSSKTDEWGTPWLLFEALNKEFGPFTLDPCATTDNAKCKQFYTRAEDGLSKPWPGRVFMNPPYGRVIGRWMEKAYNESRTNAEIVVCLVPARTDTRWWHDWAVRGEVRFMKGRVRFMKGRVRFMKGRVRFMPGSQSAPFPSAIVVFRGRA